MTVAQLQSVSSKKSCLLLFAAVCSASIVILDIQGFSGVRKMVSALHMCPRPNLSISRFGLVTYASLLSVKLLVQFPSLHIKGDFRSDPRVDLFINNRLGKLGNADVRNAANRHYGEGCVHNTLYRQLLDSLGGLRATLSRSYNLTRSPQSRSGNSHCSVIARFRASLWHSLSVKASASPKTRLTGSMRICGLVA